MIDPLTPWVPDCRQSFNPRRLLLPIAPGLAARAKPWLMGLVVHVSFTTCVLPQICRHGPPHDLCKLWLRGVGTWCTCDPPASRPLHGFTVARSGGKKWATVRVPRCHGWLWVCFCPLQPVFWTPRFSDPYNPFFKHESTFKRPQIERKFKHKNARKETHTRKKLPIDPK